MRSNKDSKYPNEIMRLIEYYLSDDNLKRDIVLYEKLSNNPNGYVDIELFLNYPKIGKEKWTKEDLINKIGKSDLIELDESKEMVRRKDNLPLPKMTYLKKKRQQEEKEKYIREEEEKENMETNDPIILLVTAQNCISIQWKEILDEFKAKNNQFEVLYGRFKDNEGHVVVLVHPNEELYFTEELMIKGNTVKISKAKGDDLIDFWKYHGSHYESCIKKRKRIQKEKNSFKKTISFQEPIKLGGKFYNDIQRVKAKAREILTNHQDNEPLKGTNNDFVLDILKYHHNYDQKSKDMKYITTGKQEQYTTHSKCFFIIKNNKKKVDFSIYKCIKVIKSKLLK